MTQPDARQRVADLATRPETAAPLVMVTAYDHPSARIVDSAGVDLVLVGDSAATVVLGYELTRQIQRDELLMLTRAVRRGVERALLVGDLPYGTYEASDEEAVANARLFVDAGCDMVKLEGADAMLPRVRAITAAGIAVMGHVGLLPQGAREQIDLRARGRKAADAVQIVEDALALERAGCCALVIEAVPSVVARHVAARLTIPVIGIGAGSAVDGQVLVLHDLIGLSVGHVPRFVRQYAALGEAATKAVQEFAADVRSRTFPDAREEYGMPESERLQLEEYARGHTS